MKSVAIAAILALASSSSALAINNNDISLLRSGELVNASLLAVQGSFNKLSIEQVYTGTGAKNSVSVDIKGDRNGDPVRTKFSPVVAKAGLQPGSVLQSGFGNSVTVTVRGEDNLFAVGQVGNNNVVSGSITGTRNQAAVTQTGNNNFASFLQYGVGNMISVRQIGW